jgi:hypothetical protein
MFRHSAVDVSEDTLHRPPKELEFPLMVNNVVVCAMLDTGANYTLMSHDFCVQHDLKISKTSGYVQLGQRYTGSSQEQDRRRSYTHSRLCILCHQLLGSNGAAIRACSGCRT